MTTDELDDGLSEQARRDRDRDHEWPAPTPDERRGFAAEERDDDERERRRDAGEFGPSRPGRQHHHG